MSEELFQKKIQLDNDDEVFILFGSGDNNLKILEDEFQIKIVTRGETINISGEEEAVTQAQETIRQLLDVTRSGTHIGPRDVAYAAKMSKQGKVDYFSELFHEEIGRNAKSKSIRAKTLGQRHYIDAIKKMTSYLASVPPGRENLFGCCHGCKCIKERKGQQNYINASCGGGWRKSRFFARRFKRKSGSVFTPALRCPS